MKYKIIGDLFSWIFPTKKDRAKFKTLCKMVDIKANVPKIKKNYDRVLYTLRGTKSKKKVLFLVNEIAKWKTQSLYDLFEQSTEYEPYIALTIGDFQWCLSKGERTKILQKNYEYFVSKNMNCIYAFDTKKDCAIDLSIFNPQLVFYQQPWGIDAKQKPLKVSEYALTFYIPYYVQNYGHFEMECLQELHQTVYRYYILNKEWENFYKPYLTDAAGMLKGLGHPSLDVYNKNNNTTKASKNYVIYAPHHSINNIENYSTFLWNGRYILNFAKEHKDLNWVFKPHPTLKYRLIEDGTLSKKEIDDYFEEWEQFAICCNDSSYPKLFLDSKVLITDSASFLTEYFCTQKPIIHLISNRSKVVPLPPFEKILNVFYQVRNIEELNKVFDEIVIQNNDSKKEERISVLKECDLYQKDAAFNILQDINEIFEISNE